MRNNLNSEELTELENLLVDFSNKEKLLLKEPTFFEIAGFPSRENVFSNVLKFFFDSRNPHGYGYSVLAALLSDVPGIEPAQLVTAQIRREVATDNLNRIDLVIETKGYIVAIENKVYHVLNNDLIDYSNYLESRYSLPIIRIVLNLNFDSDEDKQNKFRHISYRTFLEKLDVLLGNVEYSNNKYVVFLTEFVQNLKNHFPITMTKDQIDFFVKHETAIDQVIKLANRCTNYINSRAVEIFKQVKYSEDRWYKYQEVPYSFELQTHATPQFKIACTLEMSKVYIEVDYEKKSFASLQSFLKDKYSRDVDIKSNWLYIKEFKPLFEVSDSAIANEISKVLGLLEGFSEEYQNQKEKISIDVKLN